MLLAMLQDCCFIFCADPIDTLHMYSVNTDDLHDPIKNHKEYFDGEQVTMDPGEEFYFRCKAKLSNPPAVIRVYHAKREITAEVWQV